MSTNQLHRVFAVVAALSVPTIILSGGCAADGNGDVVEDDGGTPTTDTDPGGEGICLMNNCSSDEQCAGCADDRNTCLVEESRCVACDPSHSATVSHIAMAASCADIAGSATQATSLTSMSAPQFANETPPWRRCK